MPISLLEFYTRNFGDCGGVLGVAQLNHRGSRLAACIRTWVILHFAMGADKCLEERSLLFGSANVMNESCGGYHLSNYQMTQLLYHACHVD